MARSPDSPGVSWSRVQGARCKIPARFSARSGVHAGPMLDTPSDGHAPGGRRTDVSSALSQVRRATALLRSAVAAAPPECLPRAAAHELAREAGALEKLAAAVTLGYARAAGKEAGLLLAAACGTAPSTARRRLDVVRRASACPALAEAFGSGQLSFDQTAVLAPLASMDADAASALLRTASDVSVTELRSEAARLIHQRRGEAAAVRSERLLHERRYCRTWVEPYGSVRLDARFGRRDGAAVLAALRHEHDRLWRSRWAHRNGGPGRADAGDVSMPTVDQIRADALVQLISGKGTARVLGPPELLVRVDAAALKRGEVATGELCEIAGVGPVSVTAARSMLGDALWTLLVTTGSDVTTVSKTTRVIPKKVRNALSFRDRQCVVPGCGATENLEIDHWTRDFAWDGATALWNLALECRIHHEMKTRTGWRLVGGPGKWQWLPPKPVDELAKEHARPLHRRAYAGAGVTAAGPAP